MAGDYGDAMIGVPELPDGGYGAHTRGARRRVPRRTPTVRRANLLLLSVILAGTIASGCSSASRLLDERHAPTDAIPVAGRLVLLSDLPQSTYNYSAVTLGKARDPEYRALHQVESTEDAGWFLWHLSPGDYVIQTVAWQYSDGFEKAGSTKRIWAEFTVPQDAEAVYIGTLSFEPLGPERLIRQCDVIDEYSAALTEFNDELEGREPVRSLMTWSPPK